MMWMHVNVKGKVLTRAVPAIAREATQTEAEVTPHRVHTLGKLTALIFSCLTLVHIWEKGERDEGMEPERERQRNTMNPCVVTG